MDPFSTLGLQPSFELDRRELDGRFRDLQKQLHPDRHASAPASHRRMNLAKAVEVNEAYRALKSELTRADALLRTLGHSRDGAPEQPDPEFLMEVMELREALGDAKAEEDLAAVGRLAQRVRAMQAETREGLLRGFTQLAADAGDADGDGVRALVSRMRYFKRFLDEVDVIEDEAQEALG